MIQFLIAGLMTISAHANIDMSSSPLDSIFTEDAIRALRDPFQIPNALLRLKENPKSDIESYALKDIKLNGVITGAKKPRALVSLPNAKTFFISVGDRLGLREGRVVAIAGDIIRVVEYEHDENGKKIPEMFELSISGELNPLTKE